MSKTYEAVKEMLQSAEDRHSKTRDEYHTRIIYAITGVGKSSRIVARAMARVMVYHKEDLELITIMRELEQHQDKLLQEI
tara:strand:- start:4492 stop:4731 length:240 start_codon:yes stop_codon:yes gene_type:complete